jgi:pimeloyl-ACP methyl ester carboxylesterase
MPRPIPAPRESGFTTTTDVPLYWAAWGPAGAPRLVVLHGGPGAHHDYLLPQMLRLAERWDCLFYDQRGGGRSKYDNLAPVTWRTQVDDLARVADELVPGDAPLHLVGYSWGGLLALLYALHGRREPASLTLIDPAPVARPHRAAFETELARRGQGEAIQRLRGELAASGLRERDPDAYRQRAFELSVAGYFHDPEASRDLTPFRVTGRVQQSVWESLGDFDLESELGAVRCPTLVVHGRADPIPLASSEAIAAAIPGARLAVLERAGHVPYVEQPDALWAAVLPFLEAAVGDADRGRATA